MPNDSKLRKYKNDFVTSNTKYKIKTKKKHLKKENQRCTRFNQRRKHLS